MPTVCNICSTSGHRKRDCPELLVPPVGPIPPPDFAHLALLDQLCCSIFQT